MAGFAQDTGNDGSSIFQKCQNALLDLTDLEVTIPKRVRLHNIRLNRLHMLLRVSVLAIAALRLIVNRQWTSLVSDAHVAVTLRGGKGTLSDMSLEALQQQSDEAARTQLCDRAATPYEVSVGGMRRSATCLPICNASTRADNCVSPFELVALHSTPRNVLFVTGFVDASISDNGDLSQEFSLTPYEEDMELFFDYVVTLPRSYKGVHGLSEELVDKTSGEQRLQLTTAKHISTRLLGQDGSIVALFQPGEAMRLTLSEVLALAGKPDFLRESVGSMPTGHLSGLQVELRVDCKLSSNDIMKQTCDAQFLSVLRAAPDRSRLMPDSAIRAYYGVHVESQGACSYEVFDMNGLWNAAIAFLVIWHLPRQFIGILARFGLGHTSKIYNRVIVEHFHIRETMVGLILRLMMGNQCFKGIAGDDGSIDPAELVDALKTVFDSGTEHLDKHATAAMATHCWRSVVSHQKTTSQINNECFNAALLAQETVQLKDILQIFRGGHKKTALESFFLPEGMKLVEDMMFTHELSRSVTFHRLSLAAHLGESECGRNPAVPDESDVVGVELVKPEHERADAIVQTLPPPHDETQGEMAAAESSSLEDVVPRLRQLAALLKTVARGHDLPGAPPASPEQELCASVDCAPSALDCAVLEASSRAGQSAEDASAQASSRAGQSAEDASAQELCARGLAPSGPD